MSTDTIDVQQFTVAVKGAPTKEMSSKGGLARASKLSKERRIEIARKASMASKKAREEKKNEKIKE